MSRLASVLAMTVGRISPRYRTIDQWAEIYDQIIASRPISEKTRANRRAHVRRILSVLGGRTISSIRPHEIARPVAELAAEHSYAAKRMLIEARDMFAEALNYGWVDRNPAMAVRPPRIRIARRRLTFEQWRKIYAWAVAKSPPWVPLMLLLALVTGQRRGDLRKMRLSDVWDGLLHVQQEKTGTRIAIPLGLRLDEVNLSVGVVIERCRDYAPVEQGGDAWLLRKTTTGQLVAPSLSWRFEQARDGALGEHTGGGNPPSLHECRSLSERLYREHGVDTQTLLGHSNQAMTDVYNDDRGLSAREGKWKTLLLPESI